MARASANSHDRNTVKVRMRQGDCVCAYIDGWTKHKPLIDFVAKGNGAVALLEEATALSSAH